MGKLLLVFPSQPGIHVRLAGGRRLVQIFCEWNWPDWTVQLMVLWNLIHMASCATEASDNKADMSAKKKKKPHYSGVFCFRTPTGTHFNDSAKKKLMSASQYCQMNDYRLILTLTYLCLFKEQPHARGVLIICHLLLWKITSTSLYFYRFGIPDPGTK